MPQLMRLRMVSVGHPAARLHDLTMDFRGADGRAVDSTLWLRNGGGKSSILNLFFAIMRPHRHEFLGGQSEAKQRSLDDYILADDRSVTAAEWSLDAAADTLGFDGERLITGVFYERREAGSELRRLFFATRVSSSHPQSTLEGLPVYLDAGDDGRRRATLTGFRQAWLALRDRAPHLGVAATDNQHEWQDLLEGARIDPELFSYQVRMNRREGGVDELFRFASAEGFVDFLLEMALEPSLAGDVGRNIAAWRSELVRRQESVEPERELVSRMLDRLAGLREVSESRAQLCTELVRMRSEVRRQEQLVAMRRAELNGEALAAADRERGQVSEAAANRDAAAKDRARAAGLRRHAARLRLRGYQDDLVATDQQMRGQQRLAKIWAAAEPLRSALRFDQSAAANRRLLEDRQREHAPLRAALGKAAARLAGALHRVAGRLREEAGQARRESSAEREQAREYRRQAADERSTAKVAEARAAELERWLGEAQARAGRLVEDGFLETGEAGEAGLARWGEALRAREECTGQAKAQLESLNETVEGLDQGIEAAAAEHATLRARVEALSRSWREATGEREKIEADVVIRAVLELGSVDADRLAPDALDTLERAAREQQRVEVEVRAGAMQDRQALDHLTESGLLPAAPSVRRAVRLLHGRLGGQVWSGWEWLEANVRLEERAAVARRAPYLAEGVVVRAGDLERAADALREVGLAPAGPLAVVAAGGGDTAGDETHSRDADQDCGRWPELPAVVLGPGEAALYDRGAGRTRIGELQAKVAEDDVRIQAAEGRHRELLQARQAVGAFRKRYPVGWFAMTADELAGARRDEAEQAARLDKLRLSRLSKHNERKELEVRRAWLESEVRRAQAAVQALQGFVADYVKPASGWRRELAMAQRQAREATAEANQWEGLACEADERAEALAGQAQEHGENASRYEEELRRVAYVEETTSELVQISLDQLRTDYDTLKASYEQRVGAEQLAAVAQHDEANARDQRRRLARLLSEDITEQVVQQCLQDLANPDEIDGLRERAEGEARSLHARVARLNQLAQIEQESINRAEQLCSDLGVAEEVDHAPRSPELADGEANQREEAARAGAAAAEGAERAAAVAREQARTLLARAEELGRLAEQLSNVTEDYGYLFAALPESEAEEGREAAEATTDTTLVGPGQQSPGTALDELAIRQYVHRLTGELRRIRNEWSKLDDRRSELALEVRSVVGSGPPAARQQAPWLDHILAHREAELEANSAKLAEQLTLRRQVLHDQLAEIDKHRAILATELLRVAKDGLHLLRQASSLSRLPEDLPGIGGAQFLRISTDEPADGEEQRSRMAQLVDELARGDRELDGIRLAQAAVRRLARHVQVRVMHPDPALQRQAVSIPEMARFSGGEQLTGAILLYCTLANVRGRARGQAGRPSSVLVLDNPIGRASRPQFLRLQREVARAMGVQLIYTTAVNDHEALSALPNMIRLRNERVDRNSGRRLIESVPPEGDDGENGVLRAVRIGRRERDGKRVAGGLIAEGAVTRVAAGGDEARGGVDEPNPE